MHDVDDPLTAVKGEQGTNTHGDPLRQSPVAQEVVQGRSIGIAEPILGWSSPSHWIASHLW
jgi:hypothetical protein